MARAGLGCILPGVLDLLTFVRFNEPMKTKENNAEPVQIGGPRVPPAYRRVMDEWIEALEQTGRASYAIKDMLALGPFLLMELDPDRQRETMQRFNQWLADDCDIDKLWWPSADRLSPKKRKTGEI